MDDLTPLVVLVGFLGAGKTTILKQLVVEARLLGFQPAVILNDFANADVDAGDLKSQIDDVVSISGSCVCCSSQFELLAALASHTHACDGVMILEANGTTDAVGLLSLLSDSPSLAGFSAPIQVSVVDAKRWGRREYGANLEVHQIKTATRIIVSHEDEVTLERTVDVMDALTALNPFAKFCTPRRLMSEVMQPQLPLLRDKNAHTHFDHYASLSLPIPGPVHREAFTAFLSALPKNILRAKGVVNVVELAGGVRMFQVVQGDVQLCPDPLSRQDVEPVLVMVGPSIPCEEVQADLALTLAKI